MGRFGRETPAVPLAGTPRHAGISGRKKGPEIFRALVNGRLGSIERCLETRMGA